ncbi:MAG: holo-ACP synthase [Verrucomicrobia bacterium]|nr:holo-ACP synthase [Verrucomicrobiota bacterium]
MILGHGIDLVEIARVAEALERFGVRFREKLFTPAERAYCEAQRNPAPHFAARFAAKEAAAKALGSGIGGQAGWQEIEVVRDTDGRPTLRLSGHAARCAKDLGVERAVISLTHSRLLAQASVILEGTRPAQPAT